MNIFVLDNCPIKSAQFSCDKHSSKMCVELLQQLGSAVIRHGATSDMMPLTAKGTPLKGGYHHHPCTQWVGHTRSNYNWASVHALELCNEYTKRYGKVHACQKGIEKLCDMDYLVPEGELTNFALAMPNQYKNPDAVVAYRNYYLNEKKDFATWKLGNVPYWWNL